jgi:16S rRNA (cytosine967-C5)-methyltransferase
VVTEHAGAPDAKRGFAAAAPLWKLLQGATAVVAAVRAGESATPALARVDVPLRPGVQALAYAALRELGWAQAVLRLLARRAPAPRVDSLLCTALALGRQPQAAAYETFTLVDQAVEAAKRDKEMRAQASFVNACLRRFLRERDALDSAAQRDPVAQWNHPRWWIERTRSDWPHHWQQILQASNSHAPMTLRVNARRSDPAAYLQTLRQAGIDAVTAGAHAVMLARPMPVHEIPGFDDGVVSVQDAAAQLAAPLLLQGLAAAPEGRLRILDACAAPGGKTAHLLELADADVTALDISPARCERVRETLARLHLQATLVAADAAVPDTWWDGRAFDAILLDAPCTASGIVRRHPDVRWLRRESDIAQLAAQQSRLLSALWPLLRVGGRLLYCTCSVFRSEGEVQVQTFLAHNTTALLRPSPGHLRPQTGDSANGVPDNLEGDHDGFYYALLEKCAVGEPAPRGA